MIYYIYRNQQIRNEVLTMNEFILRDNEDILEKEKNMYKLLKDIPKYKEYAWKKSENARKRAKELSVKFHDIKYYVSYPAWFEEEDVINWYKKEFNEDYPGHVCSEKSYPYVPESNILLCVYKNGEIIENYVRY